MHLVATRAQTVHLSGAPDVHMREGETIRTEISCKFTPEALAREYGAVPAGLGDIHVLCLPGELRPERQREYGTLETAQTVAGIITK